MKLKCYKIFRKFGPFLLKSKSAKWFILSSPILSIFVAFAMMQKGSAAFYERLLFQKMRVLAWEKSRLQEELYLKNLKAADSNYLENQIEKNPVFTNALNSSRQLPALLADHHKELAAENRPRFIEVSSREKGGILETEYRLEYPIELNEKKLKTLLFLIEKEQPAKPNLLIKKFRLERKIGACQEEIFAVDLELIAQTAAQNETIN